VTASAPVSEPRDAAFARLALPLLPAVARIARALTRDEADADDLVQETYLRAYRHWDTFRPDSDCKRWLATICRNTFRAERVRSEKVTAVSDDSLESLAAAHIHNAARSAGVDAMYSRMDLAPAIAAAIAKLDPSFRDTVTLADVEGFSYEEIAELMNVPLGTVRSRLFRARRQLQQSLLDYAIDAGFSTSARGDSPHRPLEPDR
jgi:RNA polymerase sigma-70 factor (ECF subfamily)